jgi:hypothetical protein
MHSLVSLLARDELPQLLQLPQTLREVDSRQNLTSLALLGKGWQAFLARKMAFY